MLEWNCFFDCYVTKIVGKSDIDRYLSKNHDKLLLDKITTSDIAYAILVYENSLDVWLEEIHIKDQKDRGVEGANQIEQTSTLKYHAKKVRRIQVNRNGWTKDGRNYYEEVQKLFEILKKYGQFWAALENSWREYVKQNHNYYYS